MLTTHLKKYDIIDVADKIRFHTHNDFLDSCFGEHGNPQVAVQDVNSKCRIWMPKFAVDSYGKPKAVSSGWINEKNGDESVIITTAPTVDPNNKHLPLDYITLIFAMDGSAGDYTFRGAYVEDQNKSTDQAFFFRRIATRVQLIGNPVRNIKLLDEDRSAFEAPYVFKRPEGAQTGIFDSWQIFNDQLAAKETDKSWFEYNGSGIPKDVKWFFEVEDLDMNERWDISLEYKGKGYSAYLKREAALGRTRMFWESSLGLEFRAYFDTLDKYPIMTFVRKGKASYKIEFLEGAKKKLIDPLDDTHSQEEQEAQAESMDADSLEAAAKKRSGKVPVKKQVTTTQVSRDPYIAEYAKQRANGVCQLCGENAPFLDAKGRPYLESHHIIWLAEGGADSIGNTVALCPNCHRKMHIVKDQEDVDFLLAIAESEDKEE